MVSAGGVATALDRGAAAPAPPSTPAESRPFASLRARTLYGSAWTVVGYVVGHGVRLVSSVILFWLLTPEIFGLMTMINVFFQALEMFSDIGIIPSVIHNPRGEQREFLRTAWTMQVIRGFVLFLVSCVFAYPVAVFYEQPSLTVLIPVVGLSMIIAGFNSTSLAVLNRQLQLRGLTLLEVFRQVIVLAVTVAWALFDPSVWALIVGTNIGWLFKAVGSHFLSNSHRDGFGWHSEDARAMYRFGRWIFISTALTFLVGHLDKILMGKFMSVATLGVYGGIAYPMAVVGPAFVKKLNMQVMFPALAEIARERPQTFYNAMRIQRLALMGLSLAGMIPLVLLARPIVELLYPEEAWAAGWMLQALGAGALGGLLISSYGSALLALGKTFFMTLLLVTQLVFLIAGSLIGYFWYGELGFVIGVATVEWLNYPVMTAVMVRHRLWQPEVDLPVIAICAATILSVVYWL